MDFAGLGFVASSDSAEPQQQQQQQVDGAGGLYDDLDADMAEIKSSRLEADLRDLRNQLARTERERDQKAAEATKLLEKSATLIVNISRLFKTAQTELARKDRVIEELRAECASRTRKRARPSDTRAVQGARDVNMGVYTSTRLDREDSAAASSDAGDGADERSSKRPSTSTPTHNNNKGSSSSSSASGSSTKSRRSSRRRKSSRSPSPSSRRRRSRSRSRSRSRRKSGRRD